jgi:GDP-4-dehydro-6-deoxy-D-mannose reductase
VTGGGGFAGRHLVAHLRDAGEEPAAPARSELDLLDAGAVRAAVRELQPRAVFHLAAQASVPRSWREPRETLAANLEMTQNVLDAARSEAPDTPVVLASSGEVYGAPERLPVDESVTLRPQNPYAVSKAAGDLLAGQYAAAGWARCMRLRAFNHAGPGQSDEYVVGTLTRQVAEAEAAGASQVVLRTGAVESARDFTDVRDVVRAYAAAAGVEPDAYNVCSGRSVRVREVIDLLRGCARVELRHEVDPERMRTGDVPEIRGSAERFHEATGWEPEIALERTVADALEAWRRLLASP